MKATLTWVHYAGWEAAVFGEWVRLGGGNEVDAGCLDGCLLVRGLSFWLSCLCLGFFLWLMSFSELLHW